MSYHLVCYLHKSLSWGASTCLLCRLSLSAAAPFLEERISRRPPGAIDIRRQIKRFAESGGGQPMEGKVNRVS
ncbi:Hypothetical predicted protein [Pelobates cultripes]|uniref:Uncharacterized protein n=1 Tax=Pelobates cultripes TaxID=61616 RepID=A0AAD1W2H5_PELCU|nr:Hypothetical predicted protein [Pelobates cultripes]